MADDKIPTRQARSQPPANEHESLRTTPKGCLESIRNRKGVSDNLDLAIGPPKPNANESALEFAPEIGNLVEPDPADPSLLVDAEIDQMLSLMSAAPPQVGAFKMMGVSSMKPGAVQFASMDARSTRRIPEAQVQADFAEIQDMVDSTPVDTLKKDLGQLAKVETDPLRRPFHERFPQNATQEQVRTVVKNRLRRLVGVKVTPLTRDIVRLEFVQMMHELVELGIVERVR